MRFRPISFIFTFLILGPANAEPLSVSTLQLNRADHYEVTRSYGGQLKHRRQSDMGFETPGVIHAVHVDEGDSVSKGQILVTLDQSAAKAQLEGAMSEVDSARALVRARQAQFELSASTLKRNEGLARDGHLSKQALDELRQQLAIQKANLGVSETQLKSASARAEQVAVSLAKTVIKAPYDAKIQRRHKDEGSIISPGTPVISIVEQGQLEATIGFPQTMAKNLRIGQSYEFVVNEQQIPGKLKSILPSVDPNTATVTALFALDGEGLYGGSLAELNLNVNVKADGYWVPLSALAESQRGLWSVLVITETSATDSTVEARLVEILHRGSNAVFVRGTLQDGDLIIDSGTGRIVPGQSVRVATRATTYEPSGS